MIYIQSNQERTMPHHFDCACAMYGCIDLGIKYRLTSFEEIESGKFDQMLTTHTFIGSVEFMHEVFKRTGLDPHKVRVHLNSNRPHELMSLKKAHEISNKRKIFIKPTQIKLFTGLILDGVKHSCLENLPEDTEVMMYEPFGSPILSEWRIYALRDQIKYAGNYAGDPLIFPKESFVKDIIYKNHYLKKAGDFPEAYTIDVAILEDGNHTNVVVEYNDMWAIGNYGMENDTYVNLLRRRYREIMMPAKFSCLK